MSDYGTLPTREYQGPTILAAVRRYWLGVLVTVVFGVVIAYVLADLQPPLYEAAATVFLDEPSISARVDASGAGVVEPERFVRNAVDAARSVTVATVARDAVAPDQPLETFRSTYAIDGNGEERDSFIVTAIAGTPEGAGALVEGVTSAFRQVQAEQLARPLRDALAEQQARLGILDPRVREVEGQLAGATDPGEVLVLTQRLEAARADLRSVQDRTAEIEDDITQLGDGVRLVDMIDVSDGPVAPRPIRAAALGGLLALIVAVVIAWQRAQVTQVIKHRNAASEILGAPLLGEVPDFRSAGTVDLMPAATAPHSSAGEAYAFLVSSLLYTLSSTPAGQTILITSAMPGDGKSVTALNLALAAGRDVEHDVVLVDGDDRVRGLARLCDIEDDAPGLSTLADQRVDIRSVLRDITVPEGRPLPLVPLGPGVQGSSFFQSGQFRTALARVQELARLVIIDSPPLLAVAETSAMAGHVDGIVLIVTPGTLVSTLREVNERLAFIGTPLMGYVYNRAPSTRGNSGYGYGYGYGYGSPSKDAEKKKSGRSRATAKTGL